MSVSQNRWRDYLQILICRETWSGEQLESAHHGLVKTINVVSWRVWFAQLLGADVEGNRAGCWVVDATLENLFHCFFPGILSREDWTSEPGTQYFLRGLTLVVVIKIVEVHSLICWLADFGYREFGFALLFLSLSERFVHRQGVTPHWVTSEDPCLVKSSG